MPQSREKPTLIVIGGGPKAVALSVKNNVFYQLCPQSGVNLHVIEKQEIGHHWTGLGGFTNGRQLLGTPAEKDLGFPYEKSPYQSSSYPVIRRQMMEYSWSSYLQAQNNYSLWIDQGRKSPTHKQWAHYLKWAFDKVQDTTTFHRGEAIQITQTKSQWSVDYKDSTGETKIIQGDALVLTGPGKSHHTFRAKNHPRLLSFQSYWMQEKEFQTHDPLKIALIGGGENAASVAQSLLEYPDNQNTIDIIVPKGLIYSRGESVFENCLFTHPNKNKWGALTEHHRRDFIARTDLGVFSQNALDSLTMDHESLRIIPGRVEDVGEKPEEKLTVVYSYDGQKKRRTYDYVVCCHSLSSVQFLADLLEEKTALGLEKNLGCDIRCADSLSHLIDTDLSLKNITPKLYLPMISGFAQGPGFPNLSCLGRLSDRILENYFIKP